MQPQDIERLEKLFARFPKLENFITAGMVTLKAARTIIDVDRWLMYDIFTELLEIKAVRGVGATSWRATDDLTKYMRDRTRKDDEDGSSNVEGSTTE